jgi:hypothetical protein
MEIFIIIVILDPSLLSFLQSRHEKKPSSKTNFEQEQGNMDTVTADANPEQIGNSERSHSIENIDALQCDVSMDVEKENKDSSEYTIESSKHVHFDDKVSVISQKGLEENVVEAEELAQMASSQKWVHMDKIEPEKLEWMKDCPAPSAVKKKVLTFFSPFYLQWIIRHLYIYVFVHLFCSIGSLIHFPFAC